MPNGAKTVKQLSTMGSTYFGCMAKGLVLSSFGASVVIFESKSGEVRWTLAVRSVRGINCLALAVRGFQSPLKDCGDSHRLASFGESKQRWVPCHER